MLCRQLLDTAWNVQTEQRLLSNLSPAGFKMWPNGAMRAVKIAVLPADGGPAQHVEFDAGMRN